MNRPPLYGRFQSTAPLMVAYAVLVASTTCDRSVPRRAQQAATSAAAEFEEKARPYVEKGKETARDAAQRTRTAATQAVEEARELKSRAEEAARPLVERTRIVATQAAEEARELTTRAAEG